MSTTYSQSRGNSLEVGIHPTFVPSCRASCTRCWESIRRIAPQLQSPNISWLRGRSNDGRRVELHTLTCLHDVHALALPAVDGAIVDSRWPCWGKLNAGMDLRFEERHSEEWFSGLEGIFSTYHGICRCQLREYRLVTL